MECACRLLPLPHFGKCSPKVKIEDASATIEDVANPAAKPWAINDVNLQLSRCRQTLEPMPIRNAFCWKARR